MANKDVKFKAVTKLSEEQSITTEIDYVFNDDDTEATYTVEYKVVQTGGGGFLRPISVSKNI
jgi:hypothetical protein